MDRPTTTTFRQQQQQSSQLAQGRRIERNDWNRGQRVNDGQEPSSCSAAARLCTGAVDNNYVLAAAATGLSPRSVLAKTART